MSDGTFLTNMLIFTRLLRQAGLPVSPEQSRDFAQALTLVDVGSREQVYHAARSLLDMAEACASWPVSASVPWSP